MIDGTGDRRIFPPTSPHISHGLRGSDGAIAARPLLRVARAQLHR